MGHGVVDALDAAIGAGVVRVDVDLVDEKAFQGICSPWSEMRVMGHAHRGMYWSLRMSAVPAVVNWAADTAYMSPRRLKRSVKRRVQELPRGVRGSGST